MQTFNDINFGNGVPKHIVSKASEILLLSEARKQSPRKIRTKFGIKYVFNVGNRYRLLSNDKSTWKLLSHEKYNRYS
jgi:hypothetical protein